MKLRLLIFFICALMVAGADGAVKGAGKSAAAAGRAKTSQQKTTRQKTTQQKSAAGKSTRGKSAGQKAKPRESASDLQRRQVDAQKDIARTREQIKVNEAEVKKNLGELGRLEGDIDVSKKKVAEAGGKVSSLQKQISSLESRISTEEKTLAKMRAEYLQSVKKMQGKRRDKSALAFIFSSKSFNQAMRRMRYLKEFSDWRKRQSAEIGRRVAQLKDQQAKLAQAKSACDKALAAEVKARDELQGQFVRQDAIVVELRKNGAALNSHLQKKQAEVNALKGRVAALIAEEQRKAEAEQREAEKRRQNEAKQEAMRRAAEEEKRRAAEQLAQNTVAEPEKKEQPAKQAEPKQQPAKQTQSKQTQSKQTPGKQTQSKQTPAKSQEKKAERNTEVSYADARGRKARPAKPETKQEQKPSAKPEPAPKAAPKPEPSSNVRPTQPTAPAGTSGFASMRGSLPHPVAGHFRVTSRFGRNSLPNMPEVVYDNPGIDAEVTLGATAQAVYAGKVSGVYMVPGYQTVIIISHGDYYTVYGNISSASVKVGDNVKQGHGLGRIGADENNPKQGMIHFEVWKKRDKMDPQGWLR